VTTTSAAAAPASDDIDPDAPLTYQYKPSLIGGACFFELRPQTMAWQAGRRTGEWAYEDIAMVRMSYRPVSMQSNRYRTDIWSRTGQHVIVLSTTWRSVALVEPQNDGYRAFITELHRRIGAAGGRVLLEGGLLPWVFQLATLVLGLVAVAILGLLARAVMSGSYSGALFLVFLIGVFVWQIGGFMRRNRPVKYTPDDLPQHLLP